MQLRRIDFVGHGFLRKVVAVRTGVARLVFITVSDAPRRGPWGELPMDLGVRGYTGRRREKRVPVLTSMRTNSRMPT